MASSPDDTTRMLSAVAVTSTPIPQQHVTRTWTIKNFKQVFEFSSPQGQPVQEVIFEIVSPIYSKRF